MAIQKRYLHKKDARGKTLKGPDGKPISDLNAPRYLVRVNHRDPVTGKRVWRNVGTYRTKREAEAEERDALTKLERGTLLDPDTTTVAALLTDWHKVKAPGVSANTGRDYEVLIQHHLIPALGGVLIRKLTTDAVQGQYDAWTADGKSARIVRGCHRILRTALDWAMSRNLLYVNVAARAELPRLPKQEFDVWDMGQVDRFLEAAMHRPVLVRMSAKADAPERPLEYRPDPYTPLWHLLALEGMRRGEALGLRWRDIGWERGTAHIRQTVTADKSNNGAAVILPSAKTKTSARTVKLTPATLGVLRTHRTAQNARRLASPAWEDNDLIVCTGNGAPITPGGTLTRAFERLTKQAGLPRIRLHDLRHSHATALLRQGVPAKIVSERLGHANIGITLDTYSHVLPDMQDTAAAAIDDMLTKARAARANEA